LERAYDGQLPILPQAEFQDQLAMAQAGFAPLPIAAKDFISFLKSGAHH
jgi:hypothetical protein